MNGITMKELLERVGQGDQIQNSRLTRLIARGLMEKGYVKVRKGTGWVWVKDKPKLDLKELAKEAIRGL